MDMMSQKGSSPWPTVSSAGLFKVVRVYDSDTVKAEGHDIEIKVRLMGIDAPETSKAKHEPGQPFGRKAENGARSSGQGIWSQGDKYVSPALWRKSKM